MRYWSQLKPEERELFIRISRNKEPLKHEEDFELHSINVKMFCMEITPEEIHGANQILDEANARDIA